MGDTATYTPTVFDRATLREAMDIILTPEDGASPQERWARETPALAADLIRYFKPGPETVLLDYGCGVGRLARELIGHVGCTVIGVDISASMRAHAAAYVNSDRFIVCAPEGLDALTARGLSIDHGFSIWVLQHCFQPRRDIARIARVLRPGGMLLVLNTDRRVVPTERGWVDDGKDIAALLAAQFPEHIDVPLSPGATTAAAQKCCFSRVYRAGASPLV